MFGKYLVCLLSFSVATILGQHHIDGSFDSEEFEVGIDGPKQHLSSDTPSRRVIQKQTVKATAPLTEHSSAMAEERAADKMFFELEHSITGGHEFSARGLIEVVTSPLTRQKSIRFSERLELTYEERHALADMQEIDGFYRIRMRSCTSPTCPYVMAAIRVCELIRSDFKEELKLLLDGNGNILSLEYHAPASKRSPLSATPKPFKCSAVTLSERILFTSYASLMLSTPAQLIPLQPPAAQSPPPGMPGIPGMMGGPGGGKDGKPQSPQGILRKYWYIVVPLVLILITSTGEPPEGTAGTAGGAGGGAQGPASS
eukprot:CAMPEP_0185745644 /NCGR_PEP_ID=MMETSP1174-20130828/4046_1 /TAXON_ID=35687 /ORGANISM="Dictyocha speculum, Strain CCMP1381" /LENGTH=313 /DNA_ID=CAMNT_0028419801 /DNA_START=14 /DNA_END=955 /DNA_ORIENTATION=+